MGERTAPVPEDLDQLQQWLAQLIKSMRFARLITAVVTVVARLRNLNTELTKQLANLRRTRPRSERMAVLQGQLSLPWAMSTAAGTDGRKPTPPEQKASDPYPKPRKSRKGAHPGALHFLRSLSAYRCTTECL